MSVIIIGGAAGSKIAYEIFKLQHWNVLGFYENYLPDEERKKMHILLSEHDVDRFLGIDQKIYAGADYFVATGDNVMRMNHIKHFNDKYLKMPVNAIHLKSHISPFAKLGHGGLYMPYSVVNHSSIVGDGVIINTGAVVEHDNTIGDYAQLGPGVHLGGYVTVESLAMVGIGASALPHIIIGEGAIVAAGSAVTKDVEPYTMVAGVPAVKKKDIDNG